MTWKLISTDEVEEVREVKDKCDCGSSTPLEIIKTKSIFLPFLALRCPDCNAHYKPRWNYIDAGYWTKTEKIPNVQDLKDSDKTCNSCNDHLFPVPILKFDEKGNYLVQHDFSDAAIEKVPEIAETLKKNISKNKGICYNCFTDFYNKRVQYLKLILRNT